MDIMKEIKVIRTGVFGVNTYIIPAKQNKVFVVDPADNKISGDGGKIAAYIKENKLECSAIILTHSHFDHILGIANLKSVFPNAKIAIHESEIAELTGNGPGPMNEFLLNFFGMEDIIEQINLQPAADIPLKNNSTLDFADAPDWKVIHTPGHSPGSICLYNKEDKLLISGDTIFDYGGYGRTDMYGGDEVLIRKSIQMLKESIPAGTKVYPGHDSFGFSM